MDWILRGPQIHSTFSSLGFAHANGYHVNEHCNAALEIILHNILTEDKYLCTYRRSISFGQNIKKDLIPLLINAKEDKTVELLIKILVNLTIPIECLLSVDVISKTDYGRHTIYEINNLLATTKVALTDHRATRAIIEFVKKNAEAEYKAKLSPGQCTNISNTLLFIRNILHIPEDMNNSCLSYNGSPHNVQNQLIWNLFSQNIDKVLIRLMGIPDATNWAVTMVQLIALLYKDQHVTTLQKLLNLWLEASISDSSEDNESNTSPPDRGSKDSSPMLTSNANSDSSDNGESGLSNDVPPSVKEWEDSVVNKMHEKLNHSFLSSWPRKSSARKISKYGDHNNDVEMKTDKYPLQSDSMSDTNISSSDQYINDKKVVAISESSDFGYVTQIENQESISTSSNEDELPLTRKPIHQKPYMCKMRVNPKVRNNITPQERKRKKIVKKGRLHLIALQGHNSLTDDDISNILKEFTVDFLLKGYNSLVQTLHTEILTNLQFEIDTSHFFWLVTYFLKFATQIDLDLEHVSSVMSFEIISYLTAEGVNLCEQFVLAIKLNGNDLKPNTRRLHLAVTAIREFVQAIEFYKKSSNTSDDDQKKLIKLQVDMCETHELRSLLILLLRNYNPNFHPKQYLQDLIVTNHLLLMFLEIVMKMPEYKSSASMSDHIKQFATPEIMSLYGLMLEDYEANGEFVNDCIFTVMHHVSGELGCVAALLQPGILRTFTTIWKSDYETCEDWADLMLYVINTFTKTPQLLQNSANISLISQHLDVNLAPSRQVIASVEPQFEGGNEFADQGRSKNSTTNNSQESWTPNEISSLGWNYMKSNSMSDVIGEIVRLLKEDDIIKTRDSVIRELYKQYMISREDFHYFLQYEVERSSKAAKIMKDMKDDEIGKLCEQLVQDGKSEFLDWVQTVLLDICSAKIYLQKKLQNDPEFAKNTGKTSNFHLQRDLPNDVLILSPVSYHSLLLSQAVPLVPWNCEQANICKDLKFLQLLHKLGFHMPVDSGKVFIRIPHSWTTDMIFDVASKISPINKAKLKFSIKQVMGTSAEKSEMSQAAPSSESTDVSMITVDKHFYQINKQKHLGALVNYTPMPGIIFKTPNEEIPLPNWLKLIQKSQEHNIKFDLESSNIKEESSDVCMTITEVAETDSNTTDACTPESVTLTVPPAVAAKTKISNNPREPEYYNNSACETASVTSDLTRMYVSDEDEKSEEILLPTIKETPQCDEQSSSDCDNYGNGKRQKTNLS